MRLLRLISTGCVLALLGVLSAAHFSEQSKGESKKDEDKKVEPKKPDTSVDKIDEEILRRAELTTDGDVLVQFLKKRTLPESERPAIERNVRMLGSADYRMREKAMRALSERGVAVLEVLHHAPTTSVDTELIRRVERSIETIHEKDVAAEVPAAAVRVAAEKKPKELIETLIGYVPFADNDAVLDELRLALTKHAMMDGKVHPALLAALKDRAGARRAVAAEVLGRAAYAEHKAALRNMLTDNDPFVRFKVAQTLAFAKERDVIPTLIDTLPDLQLNAAWQAEDFLLRLALGASPPSIALGNDKDTRDKARDAWQAWWKKHQAAVDLAKLEETPKLLGRTLIVLLDQGSVLELGPDNQPRWQVKNLVFPLDAQVIDDERFLVAEYHANKVTERNLRGDILWQRAVMGPLAAQRLANGNTFIANDHQLLEYDKNNNEVMNIAFPDEGRKIMKAMKLPNGEIACMLADSRVVRYDAQGKELFSFPIHLGTRLFGGRVHMLPTGRVIVPHSAEGKVIEYDAKGKIVWEAAFEQPIAATRLPNGNTLITSMNPAVGAVEVNRAGREVWSYKHVSNTRVTRAMRR
jgi:hypothetical protein